MKTFTGKQNLIIKSLSQKVWENLSIRVLVFLLVILFSFTSVVATFAQSSPIELQHSFGGSNYDYVHDMVPTTDGGTITVGYSESNDGDVAGNHGAGDCWVV